MSGLTAYVGLLDIGQPKAGETVVLAASTGAVGSVVGQIAKLKGCRVVGIAGAQEKCRYAVEELGYDACISHYDDDMAEQLAAACPDGIDVYFENVGGSSAASSASTSTSPSAGRLKRRCRKVKSDFDLWLKHLVIGFGK